MGAFTSNGADIVNSLRYNNNNKKRNLLFAVQIKNSTLLFTVFSLSVYRLQPPHTPSTTPIILPA